MTADVIGALIAALPGAGIAFLNYSLTRKALAKQTGAAAGIGTATLLRTLIDAGFLAAVWFLAPYTPWDKVWMLAGAVIGLTLPMLFLTPRLAREAKLPGPDGRRGEDDPTKGGEAKWAKVPKS